MKTRLRISDVGPFHKEALADEPSSDPKKPSSPGKTVVKLAKGTKVLSMEKTHGGYTKCKYGSQIVWVKTSDLVKTEKE